MLDFRTSAAANGQGQQHILRGIICRWIICLPWSSSLVYLGGMLPIFQSYGPMSLWRLSVPVTGFLRIHSN